MTTLALITVFCPDRPGLIAAVTRYLFDIGGNLRDTAFAVLGRGAELSTVCELPEGAALDAIERELGALAELVGAEIKVRPFRLASDHSPTGEVTHRVTVSGSDQPGLVARLCEAFLDYGANVVTLNAGQQSSAPQEPYVIRFEVWIPDSSAAACLATIGNTAEALQLRCESERTGV